MEELLRVERDGLSNSSSSQALAVNEQRRDRERRISKGALRRSVSVNLAELWRVLEMNVEMDEESFMKVSGSRPEVLSVPGGGGV